MKREDLFLAIGEVEESRLARCDGEMPSNLVCLEGVSMDNNKNKRLQGRILRNVLVAVLTVVLLATTVWAAPIVINAIFGEVTDVEELATPTDAWGNSDNVTSYQVTLELDMNEDAPRNVETFYMPQLPEEYKHSFGYAYSGYEFDNLDIVTWCWDIPNSEKQGIILWQYSAEGFEHHHVINVYTQSPDGPQMQRTELGGVEGLLILAPNDTEYGRNYFCWSNGDYVFWLRVTNDISLDQMEQIVASIHEVEDVRPYMISMTEEEIEKTFDN